MARLGEQEEIPSGPASQMPRRVSIWNAIHPRLLEIIRERNSTILFVNSRRTAERLAGLSTIWPSEPIARAHHGSLAAAQRSVIEEQSQDRPNPRRLSPPPLSSSASTWAPSTSSSRSSPRPPSPAACSASAAPATTSDATSEGIIFPKYRADLVACSAVTRAMHEGHVESTSILRNPLDVLAQQIVATVAHPPALAAPRREGQPPRAPVISVDDLYSLVRRAAPFATLTRSTFENVLDLLAGKYPSDEFAELRPRITWDRTTNLLTPREGAQTLAILNAGTIPDRGLYGVFLSGDHKKPIRVGELDEEMVFESRVGEVFILGASTWRIDDISHDRVLVTPAPGQPGKMPFWHGDQAGRPLEFGRRIGALIRELRALPPNAAISRLVREHDLDAQAAENLLQFLTDQANVTTDRSR